MGCLCNSFLTAKTKVKREGKKQTKHPSINKACIETLDLTAHLTPLTISNLVLYYIYHMNTFSNTVLHSRHSITCCEKLPLKATA